MGVESCTATCSETVCVNCFSKGGYIGFRNFPVYVCSSACETRLGFKLDSGMLSLAKWQEMCWEQGEFFGGVEFVDTARISALRTEIKILRHRLKEGDRTWH